MEIEGTELNIILSKKKIINCPRFYTKEESNDLPAALAIAAKAKTDTRVEDMVQGTV